MDTSSNSNDHALASKEGSPSFLVLIRLRNISSILFPYSMDSSLTKVKSDLYNFKLRLSTFDGTSCLLQPDLSFGYPEALLKMV